MPAITPFAKRLMGINVAVFIVQMLISFSPALSQGVVRWFGLTPEMWFFSAPFLPFWQVVTYGFMHSTGSLMHILMNMMYLFFFGSLLEREVGARRMGIAYFGAIIFAGVVGIVTGWFADPSISTVGASGGTLGLLVMAAVLRPKDQIIFFIFPITIKTLVFILLGLDAFSLLVEFRDGSRDGVAHWVHLGGAAFGFFWARKGLIHVDWTERFERKRQIAQKEREQGAALHMDELLIKINKEGITSLSDKERAFLKKMSERGK